MLPQILVSISFFLCTPEADTLKESRIWVGIKDRLETAAPAPSIHIDRQSLTLMGVKDLHEALRTVPGVSIKDYGGIGGVKTISVRGLGPGHTKVLYDGCPVSDSQSISVDLSSFDLDDTESVSLEIGTPEDIFTPAGAFSCGSILMVRSLDPVFEGSTRVRAAFQGGSFTTVKPSLRVDRKLPGGWSAGFSGIGLYSRGDYPFVYGNALSGDGVSGERHLLREGSDVTSLKARLFLKGQTRRGGRVNAQARWTGMDRGLPGAVILYTQDATERLKDSDFTLQGSYENRSCRFYGSFRSVRTNYTNTDPAYPAPVEDNYLRQELSLGYIWRKTIFLPGDATLSFAAAGEMEGSTLEANTMACPNPSRLGSVLSLSASFHLKGLRVSGGASGTHVHEWSGGKGAVAPDRSRISPFLGVNYELWPGLRIRAFVKDGFRVPGFNDLYYDRIGSVSLMPETALQCGAGLAYSRVLEGMVINVSADTYHNSVRDKIVAVPGTFIWHMRNLGKVQMDGADVAFNFLWPLRADWEVRTSGGWSYLCALDRTEESAKNYGHQIQYTPFHSGWANISLGEPGFSFGYSLVVSGKRWFLPQNTPANELPAWLDMGVSVKKDFSVGGLTLSLGGEILNLLDINYEIIKSYPMPGRQFRINLIVKI